MGFGNWIEDYVNRIGESGLASQASGTSQIVGASPMGVSNQDSSSEQSSSDEAMESKENDGTSPEAKQSNRDKIRNLNKTFSDTSNDEDAADVFHLGDKQNRKMWEDQFIKDIGDKYSPERAFGLGEITLSRDYEKALGKYEETGDIDDLYSVMRMAEEMVARKGATTNKAAKKDTDYWTAGYNEARRKFDEAEYKETLDNNSDYLSKLSSATTSLKDAMNSFIKNPTAENLKKYESAYVAWQPVNVSMPDDLVDAFSRYRDADYHNKYSIDEDLGSRFQDARNKFTSSKAKTTSDTVKEVTKEAPITSAGSKKTPDEIAADDAMKAETEGEEKATKRNEAYETVAPFKAKELDYIDPTRSIDYNDASANSANNWSSKGSSYVDNIINKFRKKYGDNVIGNTMALKKLMSPAGFFAMAKDGYEGFKEFAKKLDAGDISDEELQELYDFLMKSENSEELFVEAEQFYDKDKSESGNAPIEKIEADTAKRTDDSKYNLGLKREDDEESKVASDEKVKSFFKTLLKFDPVVRKVGRV